MALTSGARLAAVVAFFFSMGSSGALAQTDITPGAAAVTASTSDANVPANAVDKSLSTRWSGNGTGAWLRLDLGAARTVTHLRIAFHQGDTRRFTFDLQTSTDGATWSTVWTGQSGGTTLSHEMFDFADASARYVRYYGRGNTVNGWSSLSEVEVWGLAAPAATPTPTPTLAAATPTPAPTTTPTPTPGSGPTEITPGASGATASTSDANVAANAVDGSLGTRWSGFGDGAWLRLDLGAAQTVSFVKVAVYQGNSRRANFEVQTSADGAAWTTRWSGESSGTTTALETYDFNDVSARYVRYLGHGSTASLWNSVSEIEVWSGAAPPGPTPTPAPTATPRPTATATPTPTPTPSSACGTTRTVNVANASQLTSAFSGARGGDTIVLASGTYAGRFTATADGTSTCRIVVTGPGTAVLDGGGTGTGYGIHVNGASWWEFRGFTIRNSSEGIMTDGATNNLFSNLTIYNVGEAGIHFRTSSSSNTLQDSTIHDTGRVSPEFGEGVYIGTANSTTDKSDNNKILRNHLGPNVTAEPIDVKEGTTGGLVDGNYFDSTGICGCNSADSWVQANGNGYTYSNNVGRNPQGLGVPLFKDGFHTFNKTGTNGANNVFKNNDLDVRTDGYGFWFDATTSSKGNKVCTNNTVTNAGSGVANIALTSTCP